MKHGEAATEIFDLNLNRGLCGCGCHVNVTKIMNTIIIVTIKDDNTWNMLIKSVLLDKLLDKSSHFMALANGSIHMSLLLQKQVIVFVRGKVISLQLDIDTNAIVAYVFDGAN
jgi:hypothetical protein